MNRADDRKNRPEPDDPLDRCLRDAEWPQPDQAALNRLRGHWRSARPRRRRIWPRASAVAAALMVGILVWSLWPDSPEAEPRHDRREELVRDNGGLDEPSRSIGSRPREDDHRDPERDDGEAPDPEDAAPSRPPNVFESLVLRSAERRSRSPVAEGRTAALDRAVERLLSDPEADPAALAESLVRDRIGYEQTLIERILHTTGRRQRVQIELLGHLGGRAAVPVLVRLSRSGPHRASAVRALCRLADPITLGEVAHRETDPKLRQSLLEELLSRNEPQALAVYLNFLRGGKTRASALAALDAVERPPIDLLFQFLQGANYPRRLAAAVALGHRDGPEVTERLIELVLRNVHRQEALAALLSSPGEEAAEFVSRARRTRSLGPSVHSVRWQLRFLFP